MKKRTLFFAAVFTLAMLPLCAKASTFDFSFTGPGVSGSVQLTYGSSTDATYPNAFEVTGISGNFSDSNNGLNIVNASITSLVPINFAMPESTNLLAPNDFSKFAVATGLPPQNNGFLSYDNLYWPGGSPQTASDYPLHGGFLDIYGLMFNLGNGDVVNFWSNGTLDGSGNGPIYGVAVTTSASELDYVGGVSTPEPSSLLMLGFGVLGLAGTLRRKTRR